MNGMSEPDIRRLARVSEFLFREASYLDARQWDEWLGLYTEDCQYWVPQWRDEDHPTSNPQTEMSLIYYADRSGLEDRVWRVKSNSSIASKVLPRTQHQISNIVVDRVDEQAGSAHVQYQWCVHQFDPRKRTSDTFFGSGRALIAEIGGALRFKKKKVLLLNDYVPTKLDFYSL